ncbi:RT0821/Lpp0805 family surface protein [Oceanibacterium hippocampi]|uniref:Surface antigen domain-containing protein n=1 Tax=Oceanibacterium hippocampi TaxID=745714 RepID=A0A1Y5S1W2_9PROT|nr:RT0821/Lpp0805 family surface protein [Oceanibacterium hippocampi]SLN29757.1 hypothetical protein OCH7691_01034 [Oceanibacterium hippocampi]
MKNLALRPVRPGLFWFVLLLGGCAAGEETRTAPSPAPPAGFYVALDQTDRVLARDNLQTALETRLSGVSMPWVNPASGNAGVVTPVRTFRVGNKYYCREFREQVIVGGEPSERRRTACRNEAGKWRLRAER